MCAGEDGAGGKQGSSREIPIDYFALLPRVLIEIIMLLSQRNLGNGARDSQEG